MKKKLFRMLALMCVVCILLCACDSERNITAERAMVIMLEDLGDQSKYASNPHVHTETREGQECYNIYFTLNGESWVYVISIDGEILEKGPAGHSH